MKAASQLGFLPWTVSFCTDLFSWCAQTYEASQKEESLHNLITLDEPNMVETNVMPGIAEKPYNLTGPRPEKS